MARIVTEVSELSDPNRYRFSAWLLRADGPLRHELSQAGIETSFRPFGGRRDPLGTLPFVAGLRRNRFDVVHCHTGGRSVRWMVRIGTSAGLVVHVHGAASETKLPAAPTVATDGAHVVIANSAATARRIRAKDVRVVHPGVRVGPSPRTDRSSSPRVVIGAASRLVPVKGVQNLLRALPDVRARHPEVSLEIAGDGAQRPSLEADARRLGVADHVRFLGWQPNLTEPFRRWSVFVQPSIEEGFGLAVLEAMAAGLPVVATQIGGLTELVVHGVTGLLVPPGSDRGLAEAISTLLDDAARSRNMGLAGRERAERLFTVERMVDGILRVYDDVAHRPRGRTLW
jgi:glycosyltransferase involved in cell wall biosynthesis